MLSVVVQIVIMLSVFVLNFVMLCHNRVLLRNGLCQYAECQYVDDHYEECHFGECW
jgi:hypothetical protein